MEQGKVLSIVIPTLNRYEYLKRTLDCIIPQVQRNIDKVELVICCNSSKDETDEYVKSLLIQYPFIRYKYFDEYVEVGQSLIRSVNEATGEYVVLWGDDDIPFPFFVDYVLSIIERKSDIGVIHLNRLSGKDTIYGIKGLKVINGKYEDELVEYCLSDFIQRFAGDLGFISSLVFKRDLWIMGKDAYSPTHYGYEHLAIIMKGAKGQKCIYTNFPFEIQRNPYNRDFSTKWPLYHFLGVPNMMSDFDTWGLTSDALKTWQQTGNRSFVKFLWNMFYTVSDRKTYKPLCKSLNKYQTSILRKCCTYVIVYTFPKWLFVFLKNKIYK